MRKKPIKARYFSLAIVLILINYLIFASLFTLLFESDFSTRYATRTPVPTFTPAPAEPIIIVPTPVPIVPEPSPTATQVVSSPESNRQPGISTAEEVIQASAIQQTDQPQYEPVGWQAAEESGPTRFSGQILDTAGNPVNGVSVQARCGNYTVISEPSGSADEGGSSPGFYDILIDTKPVPCIWFLTVVDTDDQGVIQASLSEPVPVEITEKKSIVNANWKKNW
jgi:hypothetical protein